MRIFRWQLQKKHFPDTLQLGDITKLDGAAKTGWYYLKKEGDNMDYIVRRLTPVECERLQGLPDNFTNVECNGKPASDSARYKAINNGMAQPCADFVLGQVVKALKS